MGESQKKDEQKDQTAQKLKECVERAREDRGLEPLLPWHNKMTKRILREILQRKQ